MFCSVRLINEAECIPIVDLHCFTNQGNDAMGINNTTRTMEAGLKLELLTAWRYLVYQESRQPHGWSP